MGSSNSISVFTDEELQAYQDCTGLTLAEISHAYKKFRDTDPLAFTSKKGRVSNMTVAESLPQLQVNPLRYRICHVFTSDSSGFMDFDDFLHMVSVMSNKAALNVKLYWAFKIYDMNDDGVICSEDFNSVLDSLTAGQMPQQTKDVLIKYVLEETDSDGDGALSFAEFERVLSVSGEFPMMFSFRL